MIVTVPRDDSKPYMRLANEIVAKQVDATQRQDKTWLLGISAPDGTISLSFLMPEQDAA